jgi:hypothetical protein
MRKRRTYREILEGCKSYKKGKQEEKGPMTYECKSWDEFQRVIEQYAGKLITPSWAADELFVTKSYIFELERKGKIKTVRVSDNVMYDGETPWWFRSVLGQLGNLVLIPRDEVERVKEMLIEKWDKKVKRLKGKKAKE